MNNNIANFILYIHYVLITFILIGHVLLPKEYLKYYILLIIIIFLDWNDLDAQCILTRLEYYYRTGIWKQKPAIEGGPEVFRPTINKIFNINLNRNEGNKLNNFIFMLCLLIAFLRLIN